MPEQRTIHYSGYDRVDSDFYVTPDWVTEALLRSVQLRGPVWEPCCGDGAISRVLAREGYEVVSSDIADRGFGDPDVDIFACRSMPEGCLSLVTNPPYGDGGSHRGQSRSPSAMLDFVRHTLSLAEGAQGQLALLVRLQWIAGKRAADLLSSGPFAAVVVLTKRIRWFDMGERTTTAQHHHAWILFDYERSGDSPPALLFADSPRAADPPEPRMQLDLFSAGGADPARAQGRPQGRSGPLRRPRAKAPADYDDASLLAAIPDAGIPEGPGLTAEAGRRRLAAAVPILEATCRRFAGFGLEHAIPEQEAALQALGDIGGGPAARAVAGLISRTAVQGPALRTALAVAGRLGADLPESLVVTFLRHADPGIRAEACRCVRRMPRAIPVLVELLDDLNEATAKAAACALGRIGRPEARPALLRLLREAPSPEAIEALAAVADDEDAVLLGRVADSRPALTAAVLEALEIIETPRAEKIAAGIVARQGG